MNDISPIPKRIFDNFTITEDHGDVAVKGNLKCSCGCSDFELLYFGKKGGILSPTIVKDKTDNGKRIVLIAKCHECHKEIRIYDSSVDGYKNRNNHETGFDISCTDFICTHCTNNNLHIEIAYNSYGKDKLLNEDITDWKECFCMIFVSGECNICKKQYKGLIEE